MRSLSARQQNHSSDRPFFDVERERKLRALAANSEEGEGSSGFLTPNDSLASSPAASTGTNYSNGSSRSCGSSAGSRSYLPDRLQIVKPLEGKGSVEHEKEIKLQGSDPGQNQSFQVKQEMICSTVVVFHHQDR